MMLSRTCPSLLLAARRCGAVRLSTAASGKLPDFEPYRIKMVEPIRQTTRAERETIMKAAGFNPFRVRSEDVLVDLLTDSGTGAMSQNQWAAMLQADEAYAGARSFHRLESTVRECWGFPHIMPTHQGRAAENLLFKVLIQKGHVIPNNMHFDTTTAHVQDKGGVALNLLADVGYDPVAVHPFKGDMDVKKLGQVLEREGKNVPLVMMTITCNSGGGQPVSMANIKAVRAVTRRFGVPFFVDAARFAENAFFIQQREAAYAQSSVAEIVREMMDCFDGALVSAKKDGLVNMGGLLAMRDESLYRRCAEWGILYEGFTTYGGLSGRDMEALAVGLREVMCEDYLAHRVGQVAFLANAMKANNVPIVEPPGGHGVYLDAKRFLPHIPQSEFPAWALSVELYLEAGVRSVEIGSVLSGRDPRTGQNVYPKLELLRLALPRRLYTRSHLEYVAAAVGQLYERRQQIGGYRFVYEPPVLRHFTAKLEPINAPAAAAPESN